MKKLMSFLILFAFTFSANAQNDKYMSAMVPKVAAVDTTVSSTGWLELGNSFERIAESEKTKWLPYYYAALCNVMNGYMLSNAPGGGTAQSDQIADKAEVLLNKAEAMEKENSDIYCIKKMIATLRMMVDPQTRYQTYGAAAAEALSKAKTLNPKNPRVYFLEGQDKFFTPEQFGGSKTEAKALFEESLILYASGKPASPIDPQWGKRQVNYFLAQVK